jgi:hypothetical protein
MHAIDLVAQHGLTVRHRAPGANYSGCRTTRTITVDRVRSEVDYVTILHEVGHTVDPEADAQRFPGFVRDGHTWSPRAEIGAWAFAFEHALVWTDAMQLDMFRSFLNHDAFTIATPDDREAMVQLLARASRDIEDEPWTAALRKRACERILQATA